MIFLLRQLSGAHFVAIGPTPVSELIPAYPDARQNGTCAMRPAEPKPAK